MSDFMGDKGDTFGVRKGGHESGVESKGNAVCPGGTAPRIFPHFQAQRQGTPKRFVQDKRRPGGNH
jgi:hypothetical protein